MSKSYSFRDIIVTITSTAVLKTVKGKNTIDIEFDEDAVMKDVAADGQAQFSVTADRSGTITIECHKTSELNSSLNQLWAAQDLTTAIAGNIQLLLSDTNRGDLVTCVNCAIKKHTPLKYAKEAGMNQWEIYAEKIIPVLGL